MRLQAVEQTDGRCVRGMARCRGVECVHAGNPSPGCRAAAVEGCRRSLAHMARQDCQPAGKDGCRTAGRHSPAAQEAGDVDVWVEGCCSTSRPTSSAHQALPFETDDTRSELGLGSVAGCRGQERCVQITAAAVLGPNSVPGRRHGFRALAGSRGGQAVCRRCMSGKLCPSLSCTGDPIWETLRISNGERARCCPVASCSSSVLASRMRS